MTEIRGAASHEGFAEGAGGAGMLLRQAREAAGVHIAALAVALKVPVARLEALEADRFDLLPDPPFVRALAGSVCRALKVDPAPVLARLPHKPLMRLRDDVGTSAARFHTQATGNTSAKAPVSRPVLWAVLLLLLGAGILILLPQARLGAWTTDVVTFFREHLPDRAIEAKPSSSNEQGAGMPPDSVSAGTSMAPGEPTASGFTPGLVVTAVTPPAANGLASIAGTGAPLRPASSTPGVASAGSEPAAPSTRNDPLLVVRAKSDSWVKVTDAAGKVLVQKMLSSGASESVTGALPLAVVIGRADAAEVQVRGQAFDLSAVARNNVARFEVR